MTPDKIPSTCKVCKNSLTQDEMVSFLGLAEKMNKDPLEAAKTGGILCTTCFIREITDQADESSDSDGAKVLRAMRRDHLGIKRVK